jgi:hypothetical protein
MNSALTRTGWSRRPRWWNLLIPVFCTGLGILLWRWIGGKPFWLDEEMIALNVRDRAFGGAGSSLWLGQSAPIAWLATERAIVLTLGTGERALRLLPALCGMATLATALWVGRRWMTVAGAAVLLLLLSCNEWLIYFPNELKHYSADAFGGLLLPALAAWVIEGAAEADARRSLISRAACWWAVAAIGQLFANGFLFVTPACALALLAAAWHRGGSRLALTVAGLGAIWAAAFTVNYALGLRFATSSAYLQDYWSFALPPRGGSALETIGWLGRQAQPLAIKPGGTALWIAFWAIAVSGLLVGRRPLGLMGLMVAASLPTLAALRVAPLFERMSLWALPMLYVGVALFVDVALRVGRGLLERRTWGGRLVTVVAGAGAIAGLVLVADILARGQTVVLAEDRRANHLVDDRRGVDWLLRRQRPGDVWMTTRLGLPAVWWYGHIPIGDPLAGGRQPDGTPIFETRFERIGPPCSSDELRHMLLGHRRILLYLGFRFDDVPNSFDDLLLNTLNEFGTAVEGRGFGTFSRAWVIDLQQPGSAAQPRDGIPGGCIRVRPAERW